jgi:zinc transport system substrate-binding protein
MSSVFGRKGGPMRRTQCPCTVLLIMIILVLIGLFSCGPDRPQGQKKIIVVTTLFPIYDFTRSIADNKADIALLLPPGVEAHAFEPKPADIIKVDRADLFIYTGKYMEPWVQDILKSTVSKKLSVVDASVGIKLASLAPEHRDEGPGGGHGHASYDPHIWLDFENAAKMVDTIREGLCKADPADCTLYRTNADNYKEKLSSLDKRYRESLSHCRKRTLIHGGHFAFGYLARRYGLEYISAYEGSPNSEPTARKMMSLQKKMKEKDIHYIFYEELLNPKVSEILAQETGAKLLKLNGAHNITRDEFSKGVTFLSLMEDNLVNLKAGLECE